MADPQQGSSPIDYGSLAQQARGGGTVDYSALADQARGGTPQPRTWLDSVTDFAKGAWNNLAETGQSMVNAVTTRPDKTIKAIGTAQDQARVKAEAAFKRGDYAEGVRHVLGYLIPLAGPSIDASGDKAQQGKVAEALGEAASTGLQLAAPEAIKLYGPGPTPVTPGAPNGMAERLYQGALNPRINTPPAEVRGMVATGLENAIPISEEGAAKLNQLLTDLNQQIEAKVGPAAQRGVTIDPNQVVRRLDDVERRVANQVNPEQDVKAVNNSGNEFLRSQGATPGTPPTPPQPTALLGPNGQPIMTAGTPGTPATRALPMPADQAQAVKVGTYQKLAGKYGDMATDAQVEAQKALARGIKEELNTQLPELLDLNTKESKLFDLQGALEQAVAKAANRQGRSLLPATPIVTGAAATMASGSPLVGGAVGILKAVLADPKVASRLAIMINKAQQANPAKWGQPSLASAMARVNQFAAALSPATQQAQQ